MKAANPDCALTNFGPLRTRKGIGGPNTAKGKSRSSQNSRKHGCRSKEKILPGERRADYDALWEEWLGQYEPESPGDLAQLERLVDGAWRLRRTEAAYTDVERALRKTSKDAAEWPEELVQRLQVMQRYRTNAENTLHKELRALELVKARRDAERRERERKAAALEEKRARQAQANPEAAQRLQQLEAERDAQIAAMQPKPTAAQLLFRGQKCVTERRKKPVWLRQDVEIRVVDGFAVTELWPSNAELIAAGQAMMPAPTGVLRRLHFPDGIPAEYDWVGVRDAEMRQRGGSGVQRMTVDTWLEVKEREEAEPDGHLLPVPKLRRGRDEHAGACECPVCRKGVEILRGMVERGED